MNKGGKLRNPNTKKGGQMRRKKNATLKGQKNDARGSFLLNEKE